MCALFKRKRDAEILYPLLMIIRDQYGNNSIKGVSGFKINISCQKSFFKPKVRD